MRCPRGHTTKPRPLTIARHTSQWARAVPPAPCAVTNTGHDARPPVGNDTTAASNPSSGSSINGSFPSNGKGAAGGDGDGDGDGDSDSDSDDDDGDDDGDEDDDEDDDGDDDNDKTVGLVGAPGPDGLQPSHPPQAIAISASWE